MRQILSPQNPVIKEAKLLKQKKAREEKRLFFIEGIRFVEEGLKEKITIERIFVSDQLCQAKGGAEILSTISAGKYEVYSLPDKLFRELSDTENPQGILAIVRSIHRNLEDILSVGDFYIVLDSLQDPGNLGTIIRTADAAGVSGIIISKGSVDLYNPKVLRSTMGSVFHVPISFSPDLSHTLRQLKSKGIRTYAAHLKGTADYFEVDMGQGAAIIIGNEANGINDEVAVQADTLVKIPMSGKAESLNASVAASLLMYEVVRQRRSRK